MNMVSLYQTRLKNALGGSDKIQSKPLRALQLQVQMTKYRRPGWSASSVALQAGMCAPQARRASAESRRSADGAWSRLTWTNYAEGLAALGWLLSAYLSDGRPRRPGEPSGVVGISHAQSTSRSNAPLM